ncbi:hypothetical protein PS1_003306 [Malus domestica]
MEARRQDDSKLPEIDVFKDIYVQPGDELTEQLHAAMVEKIQSVLQETAPQLLLDTRIEGVDLPEDARFQILTKTLDQTLDRRSRKFSREMENAWKQDTGPSHRHI